MAHFEERLWEMAADGAVVSGGAYRLYHPDPVLGRPLTIDPPTFADVTDAQVAIARLEDQLRTTPDLTELLVRAEALASSAIEGIAVDPRRLLRADAARRFGQPIDDERCRHVLANVDAMTNALALVSEGTPITTAFLLALHNDLLAPTALRTHAGRFREQQNWIGGSAYAPYNATYVPPPPDNVVALMDDLCAFCNDDALPALAQAAIAHAQFETIHPFGDGNGRIGRVLIHLVLRRRGLTARATLPLSAVLATRNADYIA